MKPTTNLTKGILLRLGLIALLMAVFIPGAGAQTNYTSDQINKAVLLPGSIVPEWTQPAHPWQIDGNHLYAYDYHDDNAGGYQYLIFTYTSEYPTVICAELDSGNIWIRVDPDTADIERHPSYSTSQSSYVNILPAGKHSIYLSSSNDNYPNQYIRDIGIFECRDIDPKTVLNEKSKAITFTNDADHPWATADGYIMSSRTGTGTESSKITLTFTIDKPAVLSWEQAVVSLNNHSREKPHSIYSYYTNIMENSKLIDRISRANEEYNEYYDGEHYQNFAYTRDHWEKYNQVFEPGTHTITIEEDQRYKRDDNNYKRSYQTCLRNIKLSDECFAVDVVAGDLGNSVVDEISRYGYKYLTDVDMLKVSGRLNDTDWGRIYQMTNLKYLDLKDTDVTEIPANAFKSNKMMTHIILPDGLKSIGNDAFNRSHLTTLDLPASLETIGNNAFQYIRAYDVTVPASVLSIGNYAFANSWTENITFAEDSQLSHLGAFSFAWSDVKSVKLPDSLNDPSMFATVGSMYGYDEQDWRNDYHINAAFRSCSLLESIQFPKSLTEIPATICYNTQSLKSVIFPENLRTIWDFAFEDSGLTSVEFPGTLYQVRASSFRKNSIPSETCEVKFPESLRHIYGEAFRNWNLETVELPLHMQTIYKDAFKGNTNLKTLRMHSGAKNLPKFLDGCDALQTIILPCATPPSIEEDILGSQDRSKINLIVPDFALSSYRLDDYWYLFGNINAGDEAGNVDYWRVTGDLVLRNGRRMAGNPDVEIDYGASMMVNGTDAANMKSLTFNFSEDSPAAFVNNCAAAKADAINVRFSVEADKWYFITPMFDVNIADIDVTGTEAFVFRYYDAAARAASGTGSSWKNVTDGVLHAGQGYIFQCDTACEVVFPENSVATSNVLSTTQTDVPLETHASENAANADWNFIGNPYPSYFDIWYLDTDAPITVWDGSTYRALSLTDDEYTLRPMQALFIQKPADGADAVFTIDGRQPTGMIGNHQVSKMPRRARGTDATRSVFNLELTAGGGEVLDRTRVVINERASEAYESRCDAAKFMSMDRTMPQLYTVDMAGNRLAINERPLASASVTMGFKAGEADLYTISATKADGEIWLRDETNGMTADLTAMPYTFHCDPMSENAERFTLIFRPVVTSVGETVASQLRVMADGGSLRVENPSEETVDVYSIDGMLIASSAERSFTVECGAGLYIVKGAEHTVSVAVK